MTTAATLRRLVQICVTDAIEAEPADADQRARIFLAYLRGRLKVHGETELIEAILALASRPAPAAAAHITLESAA